MMRAVCYTRVSTTEQATEGFSLAAQKESAHAYCKAHGWELVQIYTDAGKSGGSVEGRDALARLLTDAAAGQFERVIVWKLDRLGRNLRDLLSISDQLELAGAGVVSIQESIDTGTAAGRMMRSILGSLAEFERETIVARITAGLAQKARSGELLGPLPVGYLRDEHGAVAVDEATASLVRESFERYAVGDVSVRELAKWMSSVGLRTGDGHAYVGYRVMRLLRCVTYTGKIAYRKRAGSDMVLEGNHPAIVDAVTFERVQQQLRRRRRNAVTARPFGRDPYPLSGVGVCGHDGAALLGVRSRGGRYMRCATAQGLGKAACEQPMVRAELLEAQMAAYVSSMSLPVEYLAAVVAELRERHELRERPVSSDPNEIRSIERRIERWRRLFVMDEIDEERYRREAAPLKQRLTELEPPSSPPAEALDAESALAYLRDSGALWAESPRRQQRAFVKEVFQRIVVTGPQLTMITPTAAYAPLFAIDRLDRFAGDMGVVLSTGQKPVLQCSRRVLARSS